MPDSILVAILIRTAASIATKLAQQAFVKLSDQSSVGIAITRTADTFIREIEGLHRNLAMWVDSDAFANLIRRIDNGERPQADAEIVHQFLKVTHFSHGEDSEEWAKRIVKAFLANLDKALYRSNDAIPLLASRMEKGFSSLQHMLSESRGIAPDDVDRQVTEARLNTRLDETRTLLKEGRAKTAKARLLEIREEVTTRRVPSQVLFRIATNLGACALHMNQIEEAEIEFRNALCHQPLNPKGLANLAHVHFMREQFSIALENARRAFELDPKDGYVAAVYLRSLHKCETPGVLASVTQQNPWFEENTHACLALGSIACSESDYPRAEHFARQSLQDDQANFDAYNLLATSILRPIEESYQNKPLIFWLIPESTRSRIREAEEALNAVITLTEGFEVMTFVHEALVNRAIARSIRGNYNEALEDCERVLVQDAEQRRALAQRGLILMYKGHYREAAASFERAIGHEESGRHLVPYAFCLIQAGQREKAKDVLLPLWVDGDADTKVASGDLLLELEAQGTPGIPTRAIEDFIRSRAPSDARAASILAQQYEKTGDTGKAIETLSLKLDSSTGPVADILRMELTDMLGRHGRFREAAEVCRPLVDTSTDNSWLRKYLTCLFRASAFAETLRVAQSVRAGGPAIPLVSQFEAAVLCMTGDLELAEGLLTELVNLEPDRSDHVVNLAVVKHRRGNREGARQTIEKIRFNDIKDDSEALVEVARIREWLQMSDVLRYSLRARRVGFDRPRTHLAYILAFLNREESADVNLDPTCADVGCTVRLAGEEKTVTYHIVSDKPADPTKGELLSSDSVAQRLMGKRVGDTVSWPETALGSQTSKVVEVLSTYVYAFQETLRDFRTWFPEVEGLFGFNANTGGVDKLLEMMNRQQDYAEQLISLYQSGPVSVGMIAELMKASAIEVWSELTSRSDVRFIVSSGKTSDQEQEALQLRRSRPLVLEITALCTVNYLKHLTKLPQLGGEILVPQSVVDVLGELLLKMKHSRPGSLSLRKIEDRYYHHEVTSEEIRVKLEFIDQMLGFCRANCTVMPVPALVSSPEAKVNRIKDMVGTAAMSAVLLALDKGAVLYSDDMRLRLLAQGEFGVYGVSTQSVLKRLKEREALSGDEFSRAVLSMVERQYFFMFLEPEDFVWALTESGMTPNASVVRLFERIRPGWCDEQSAINCASDVLKTVWVKGLALGQKAWVLDLTINSLLSGRNSRSVVIKLRAALEAKLILAPIQQQELLRNFDLLVSRYFIV